MLSIPRFTVGKVRLSWALAGERLSYSLDSGFSEPIVLNPKSAFLALLADGERTLGDIYDAAIELGARPRISPTGFSSTARKSDLT